MSGLGEGSHLGFFKILCGKPLFPLCEALWGIVFAHTNFSEEMLTEGLFRFGFKELK